MKFNIYLWLFVRPIDESHTYSHIHSVYYSSIGCMTYISGVSFIRQATRSRASPFSFANEGLLYSKIGS